jgi:hypothetical protein
MLDGIRFRLRVVFVEYCEDGGWMQSGAEATRVCPEFLGATSFDGD